MCSVIEIKGERFAIVPESEYLDLLRKAGQRDTAPLPAGLLDLEGLVDAEDHMAICIGSDLKAARVKAGLTQEQLAAKLSRSQAMVSAAERGAIEVGGRYAQAVLAACGLPHDWKSTREVQRRIQQRGKSR